MRTVLKCLTLLVVLLLPATVFAQASLTGTVRDASGGVLPGVTVEASSPALIEKVRSAITDDTGQYRIIDLRPGTYSLTFTLPGFNTVKRDGIELTGSQTLTIPVEMRVGGLEETITVTGESPVVDVQSTRREIVLSNETIQTIPATRAAGALLNATPGIIVGEAALATSPTMTSFNARSSTINSTSVAGEGRYAINGFPADGGAQRRLLVVRLRHGERRGNRHHRGRRPRRERHRRAGHEHRPALGRQHLLRAPRSSTTAGEWSSGDNLTDEIQALNPNLREAPGVIKAYDWSASFGGPIMQDRLWFFGSYRDLSSQVGMEGISGQRQCRQPGALGLGGLADRGAARAGPHDDHRAHDGAVRQAPHPLQLRVPAPLRGHAAQGRDRGLPQSRRGLDRSRQQPEPDPDVAGSHADRGARLLRRAVLREPGHVDDAGQQPAALRGGLQRVPLPADLRPPGARWRHQPDLGHGAVERDQPGHRAAVCAGRELPVSRRRDVGPGHGQDR